MDATGQIGLFKFTSEGSVSAGVRRVEAITGIQALEKMREQEQVLNAVKVLLKGQGDIPAALKAVLEEKAVLQKKVETLENEKLQGLKSELLETIELINGVQVIAKKVAVPNADGLKQLAYDLKAKMKHAFIVLGAEINGKPLLAVMIDDVPIELHAGKIVKDAAREMRGGGGGQPHFATAGGSDVNGLQKAIDKAKSFILG